MRCTASEMEPVCASRHLSDERGSRREKSLEP